MSESEVFRDFTICAWTTRAAVLRLVLDGEINFSSEEVEEAAEAIGGQMRVLARIIARRGRDRAGPGSREWLAAAALTSLIVRE